MTDFLVSAPDALTLAAVAGQVKGLTDAKGVIIASGLGPVDAGWAWTYVPVWPVPTGKTLTDTDGNSFPEMAPKPGVFGLLRWQADPATIPLPAGAVPATTPAVLDSDGNVTALEVITITAGPVTLTTDIPADFPVRFA